MSENLKFLSMCWNVQIPRERFVTSVFYPFKGGKWFMDCGVETGSTTIFLDVCALSCPETPTIDDPWSIYIMVRGGGNNGRVLEELCYSDLLYYPKAGSTWRRRTCDIERVCPEFRMNRTLSFIVTIDAKTSASPQPGIASEDPKTICTSSDASEKQIIEFSSTTPGNEPPLTASIQSLVSLSNDFAKLMDEKSDPDVEFKCGDLSTRAHRTVVCARSPVLAKMLNSDMVEGKSGIAKIEDMGADTFRQLLRYLYTGTLEDLTFETAVPIYEAADQYAVLGLASRCAEFITRNLTAENAYEILVVADAHSDDKFVESVVDYMTQNKFPVTNDRWSSFCDDQPKLSNKVFKRFCEMSKWTGWKE